MAELLLQSEACLLSRAEGAEHTRPLALLSATDGILHAHLRKSRKNDGAGLPDLFDELWLGLASDNQGRSWFVREHRVLRRRSGIGASYAALEAACLVAAAALHNPMQLDGSAVIHNLVTRALDALDTLGRTTPPLPSGKGTAEQLVYLKFLYSFARDEGYAVREHWFAQLPPRLREQGGVLLSTPLSGLAPELLTGTLIEELCTRLSRWVLEHTDLKLSAGRD